MFSSPPMSNKLEIRERVGGGGGKGGEGRGGEGKEGQVGSRGESVCMIGGAGVA